MNDKLSASWVLVIGTIFIAYYYYRSHPGNGGGTATVSPSSKSGLPPVSKSDLGGAGSLKEFMRMTPVPLTGPDFAVGKMFKSDAEFSDAVNRAINRARRSALPSNIDNQIATEIG